MELSEMVGKSELEFFLSQDPQLQEAVDTLWAFDYEKGVFLKEWLMALPDRIRSEMDQVYNYLEHALEHDDVPDEVAKWLTHKLAELNK